MRFRILLVRSLKSSNHFFNIITRSQWEKWIAEIVFLIIQNWKRKCAISAHLVRIKMKAEQIIAEDAKKYSNSDWILFKDKPIRDKSKNFRIPLSERNIAGLNRLRRQWKCVSWQAFVSRLLREYEIK